MDRSDASKRTEPSGPSVGRADCAGGGEGWGGRAVEVGES